MRRKLDDSKCAAFRRIGSVIAARLAFFAFCLLAPPLFAQSETYNWVKVTPHANWQARDSQGEVVYNNRMWILGGWFDSWQKAPRDVWASANGKDWELIEQEAPWKHSDLPMSVVFGNKMWLMGGWYNGRLPDHSASNEVWCSTNGTSWQQVSEHAGWSPRLAAGIVEFRGKMWILGGSEDYYSGDEQDLRNDVWSSTDGKQWKLEVANAPWAPRAFHQAVVLNDRIYLMGGGNYKPNYQAWNDVWCSEDGVHWKQVTANAAWAPRLWFSAVAYRDCIWVLGGWSNNPSRNWGDVWYSQNGADWTELKSSIIWGPRHEHSTFVFQNKMWVAGGMEWPLTNDVWSLELPENWLRAGSSN